MYTMYLISPSFNIPLFTLSYRKAVVLVHTEEEFHRMLIGRHLHKLQFGLSTESIRAAEEIKDDALLNDQDTLQRELV